MPAGHGGGHRGGCDQRAVGRGHRLEEDVRRDARRRRRGRRRHYLEVNLVLFPTGQRTSTSYFDF